MGKYKIIAIIMVCGMGAFLEGNCSLFSQLVHQNHMSFMDVPFFLGMIEQKNRQWISVDRIRFSWVYVVAFLTLIGSVLYMTRMEHAPALLALIAFVSLLTSVVFIDSAGTVERQDREIVALTEQIKEVNDRIKEYELFFS